MKSYDFKYDNMLLSDKGFIICNFGSNGLETVSNGSQITFNTVSMMHGNRHELTSAEYEDYITATFQICKHPCASNSEYITLEELRDIMRWLNRKEYHEFQLIDNEYANIVFQVSFNVSKLEFNGKIYGLELELFTNKPFATLEPILINFDDVKANDVLRVYSQSDEEGYLYPSMQIEILSDGDFELYNNFDKRTMRVANCIAGEIITANYPIIESNVSSHKIQNDFNWKFFRIANSFDNHLNELTVSLPCNIEMSYSPIAKVSI